MFKVIFKIVEIIAPADYELASKDTKGNYIGRAFPPIIQGKSKGDCRDYQGGAKVRSF